MHVLQKGVTVTVVHCDLEVACLVCIVHESDAQVASKNKAKQKSTIVISTSGILHQ